MKDFWESQALKYKNDTKAVNFDPLSEELELHSLEQLITDDAEENICDIGCGNGRTLLELAHKKRNHRFHGLDFSEEMIAVAEEQKRIRNISNVNFHVADAISANVKMMFNFNFDKVISKRLLINIKGKDKYSAIENIHDLLKNNGIYIMVECFKEPLEKINKIREALNVEAIKIKPFNEYLNYDFLDEISDLFEIVKKVDFGSLYYFTSRIYNACLSQGEPDYYAPINRLAAEITKMGIKVIEDHSPEVIFILRKRKGSL